MLSSIQDRERAFEEKFSHDKDLEFKIKSRRNQLFGLWIAQQIKLKQGDAEVYARDLVSMVFKNPKDEALLAKVSEDLKAKDKVFTSIQLKKQLQYCYEDARDQLLELENDGKKKR
jgi:hypothetical protein